MVMNYSNRSFGGSQGGGTTGGSWSQTVDPTRRYLENGRDNPWYNPNAVQAPAPQATRTLATVSNSAGTPSQMPSSQAIGDLTNIADPWASQRGQYQTQLSSLMKDPSSFLQSDLWKASTAAGLEGINRSAAAGGMLKSGNRLQALMDYGQKNAPDNFFRMADLLGGFAGARNQNPGGGLSAYANLQNANTSAFNADTSRRAQEAGMSQWNTARQDQMDQQKAQLDQLSQWQQQQQQQQNNNYWNSEHDRLGREAQDDFNRMTYGY